MLCSFLHNISQVKHKKFTTILVLWDTCVDSFNKMSWNYDTLFYICKLPNPDVTHHPSAKCSPITPYSNILHTVDIPNWNIHPGVGESNSSAPNWTISHDDIKWKHLLHYWPFVKGIHWWSVDSPHKGQWHGALMFSLICTQTKDWANNRSASDLRCHCTYYDVIVMWNHRDIWLAALFIMTSQYEYSSM